MDEDLTNYRVAVTGANGFIGSAVVKEFLTIGAKVSALNGPDALCGVSEMGEQRVVSGDICDSKTLLNVLMDAEAVVHLAGPPSVAGSFETPAESVRIHTAGTAALLDACVRSGVKRVVYVSSAEVYGRSLAEFVSEDHGMEARSPYAAAKIGTEKLVEAYRFAYGLETVILRPFSVYGPGASPRSLVSTIVSRAREGCPVVLNDLRPVRDYCHVHDVARGIVLACRKPVAGMVFNVGTMLPTSVLELANIIVQLTGRPIPITENTNEHRPGGSEIFRLVADNRRAVQKLAWNPEISLDEGLRSLLGVL